MFYKEKNRILLNKLIDKLKYIIKIKTQVKDYKTLSVNLTNLNVELPKDAKGNKINVIDYTNFISKKLNLKVTSKSVNEPSTIIIDLEKHYSDNLTRKQVINKMIKDIFKLISLIFVMILIWMYLYQIYKQSGFYHFGLIPIMFTIILFPILVLFVGYSMFVHDFYILYCEKKFFGKI